MSAEAMNFMKSLLKTDRNLRLSAANSLNDPFFSQDFEVDSVSRLTDDQSSGHLYKAALHLAVRECN